jgi:hypothetical protein
VSSLPCDNNAADQCPAGLAPVRGTRSQRLAAGRWKSMQTASESEVLEFKKNMSMKDIFREPTGTRTRDPVDPKSNLAVYSDTSRAPLTSERAHKIKVFCITPSTYHFILGFSAYTARLDSSTPINRITSYGTAISASSAE